MTIPLAYRPQITRPRSAYVHIPFCRHRCGYCNFALVANRDYLVDRFLDALQVELSWIDERYELDTLFLGGGTPTHLKTKQLLRLFSMLRDRFDFSDAEVTTEANPSDLTVEKVDVLCDLGINRFSLGVQSFRQDKLHWLERDHNAETVNQAVRRIQERVPNLSFDLIFATMAESELQWLEDLRSAVQLNPTHLSTYELTIEKGTPFWSRHQSGELECVDEDRRADLYQQTIEFLIERGFEHYEISSFSLSGYRCQHNLVYWSGQPYFAFGPGASRYIDGVRETNHSSVSTYIKRLNSGSFPVAQSERLSPELAARELLVVGLRKMEGIVGEEFQKQTNFDWSNLIGEKRQYLFEQKLLTADDLGLRLTPQGIMLYDSIAEVLLKD